MPKGVEHDDWVRKTRKTRDVSSSVMPKGVEHHTVQALSTLAAPCRVQ